MKKVFFLLSMLTLICADNVHAQQHRELKNAPVISTEKPVTLLKGGLYQRKAGDMGISIPDCHTRYAPDTPIPVAVLNNSLICSNNRIGVDHQNFLPFYQHTIDYSRDMIMKLPAANTNDIIKILDKDRLLTQW